MYMLANRDGRRFAVIVDDMSEVKSMLLDRRSETAEPSRETTGRTVQRAASTAPGAKTCARESPIWQKMAASATTAPVQ
jgi:hypothetical protein